MIHEDQYGKIDKNEKSMSQELYYSRVSTVREARNYQREFAPVISQILNAAPIEVSYGVKKCCKKKRAKSKHLLAPTELKVIQADFDKHLAAAREQTSGDVEQLKVAAIATLVKSQDNLSVTNHDIVAEKIHHILDATTTENAEQEIKSAFLEIKTQHTQSFVSHVTQAVKDSAAAVGFTEIRVQKSQESVVRVIATNPSGQNLVAEVQTNKQVDIRTELIGFTDGSCTQVMRTFEEEMETRGISTKQKEQRATHGVPQMPYTQKMLKQKSTSHRSFDEEETIHQSDSLEKITIK